MYGTVHTMLLPKAFPICSDNQEFGREVNIYFDDTAVKRLKAQQYSAFLSIIALIKLKFKLCRIV